MWKCAYFVEAVSSDELRGVRVMSVCVCVCAHPFWLFVPAVNFRSPSFRLSRRQAYFSYGFSFSLNFCVLHELLKLLAKAA